MFEKAHFAKTHQSIDSFELFVAYLIYVTGQSITTICNIIPWQVLITNLTAGLLPKDFGTVNDCMYPVWNHKETIYLFEMLQATVCQNTVYM